MNQKKEEKIDYRSLLQQALLEMRSLRAELAVNIQAKTEPVAIIGMACRFPGGANTPEAYWQLLQSGVDAITQIPSKRWLVNKYYDADPDMPGKMYTRYGGFIDEVEQFDPQFFGISPREAMEMDPQQRLLLELSYSALESAGQSPQELIGSKTGVYIGISFNDYAKLSNNSEVFSRINAYSSLGNTSGIAVGRLSYTLGLTGPTMQLDTTCSSSLLAVHLACQSLRNGESNLALAGGVNLILSPEPMIGLCKLKALSVDGRCKTFDANANGYVRGEGCGILVLKRLSNAIANGDNILAIIRGSAVNHNGQSNGLTAPNGTAQEALIRQALANAQVKSNQIQYIETHGTGTSLGDPIEVNALGKVFTEGRGKDNPLFIGSVKTNIGHLESAAGVASLIKVVLSLQHQVIPPHLHFQQPNPHIPWENLPFAVPTQLTPWISQEVGRLAGVSSFGMSGTNVHIIIGERRIPTTELPISNSDFPIDRTLHLLTLSAKTPESLQQYITNYQQYLTNHKELSFADVCYSANIGRSHFKHRLGVIADSTAQAIEKISSNNVLIGISTNKTPIIAFLFTGQGSQYPNMGLQLYQTEPTFRQVLDECDQILQPYLQQSLLDILYSGDSQLSNFQIHQTVYTQPILFALEYALYKLWISWGVQPDVVMGHSVGEYVAATVAGVFSLEDGLKLIAHRGRLMQALPNDGEMVAVLAEPSIVDAALEPYRSEVSIAAVNALNSLVISGKNEAIKEIRANLEAQGIKTKTMQVSHAFHSPLMEPMLVEFRQVAEEVAYSCPKVKIISNLTGVEVGEEIATAEYWCNHILCQVQFATGMKTLEQQGIEVFLEVGPQPILVGMGQMSVSKLGQLWLPSLHYKQSDWQQLLESLSQLYVRGVKVDWSGFDRNYPRHLVVLPTYPFQRQRYWIESTSDLKNAKIQDQLSSIWSELAARIDLNLYDNSLLTQIEQLSCEYVLEAFTKMGWSFQVGERFSTELAVQRLRVVAQHRKLFKRLLQMLAEKSIIMLVNSDRDNWQVIQNLPHANPQRTSESVLNYHPFAEAELNLLSRCGSQLSSVLQGTLNSVNLVFPVADLSLTTRLYQDSPIAKVFNTLVQLAVTSALSQVPQNREVRLLEIGAGTGGTTSYVLPHLSASRVEYTFTDISTLFTSKAQARFAEYPFVRYQILNIELSPTDQGFEAHRYDIIIAANVVHATSSISQTLQYIQQLLVPGGLLVLVEVTEPQRWLDLTFGLLKDWWRFNDLDLRPDYPLLSVKQWEQVLQENGFKHTISLPHQQEPQVGLSQQAMIVALADKQHSILEEIETNQATSNQKHSWQLQNQIKQHPFLGHRLKSLACLQNTYVWETEIDEQYLFNFKDYQVWDNVVMPHTAYIEIALAATEEALGVQFKYLTNLEIHQPLFLSKKGDQKIQFVLTSDPNNKIYFHTYSCQMNQQSPLEKWTLYATAQIQI